MWCTFIVGMITLRMSFYFRILEMTAGFVFALGVKDEYAGDVVYVYHRDDYAEDLVLF